MACLTLRTQIYKPIKWFHYFGRLHVTMEILWLLRLTENIEDMSI